MIGIRFRVVVNGVAADGRTSAIAVVEMERKFDVGAVDLFVGDSPRMEALYWLAWRSLHPAAATATDAVFDAWLAGLTVFEVDPNDPGLPVPAPPA